MRDIARHYSMISPEQILLEKIVPSAQPLRSLNSDVVADLMRSIRTNGLLQPILVRPVDDYYEVVFGNHRREACRLLCWESIPAFVKKMSPEESFLTRVVENVQRNIELDPIAEAKGYIGLMGHGWTINSIAERIGKSDSYVSDRIGLIRRLHPKIAQKVYQHNKSHLKPSHCELLARIDSKRIQLELSELIERKRISVRQLEALIQNRQPFKETVQANEISLYVRLPPSLAQHMNIEVGTEVYIFTQSRSRLLIETSAAVVRRRSSFYGQQVAKASIPA